MDPSTAITVGGVALALMIGTAVFRAVGWIRDLVSKTSEAQEKRYNEALEALGKRIDRSNDETKEIRENYVRHVDLDRHFMTFEEKLDGFGSRLDDVMKFLTSRRDAGGQT